MPPAVAALLATLAALLRTLARAWPARVSTADASPGWSAISPAPAERASSSVPGSRSRSPPGSGGDLGCGDRGGNGKIARYREVPTSPIRRGMLFRCAPIIGVAIAGRF